jgi:DNA-binding Lrp family transcriptional regulator
MVSALVLLNTNIDQTTETVEKIRSIKGVEEAHALWGVYDLMVKVNSDSIDDLKYLVNSQLRQAGAYALLTLMVDSQI